jgi:hypothetical protein
MNERDERASGADPRPLVNQAGAAGFQFAEFRIDVVDFDAKVMNSGAALSQKLPDRSFLAGGFEQFDAAFADRQHGDSHALILYYLDLFQFEAERVAPEHERAFDRFYGDAQVLNDDLFWTRHKKCGIDLGPLRIKWRHSSGLPFAAFASLRLGEDRRLNKKAQFLPRRKGAAIYF